MNREKHQVVRDVKLTNQAAQQRASEILRAMPGVMEIETLKEQQLRITYDITKLSWAVVCDTLIKAGLYSKERLFERWRDNWRDFIDHNMRENHTHRTGCCSKPPIRENRR